MKEHRKEPFSAPSSLKEKLDEIKTFIKIPYQLNIKIDDLKIFLLNNKDHDWESVDRTIRDIQNKEDIPEDSSDKIQHILDIIYPKILNKRFLKIREDLRSLYDPAKTSALTNQIPLLLQQASSAYNKIYLENQQSPNYDRLVKDLCILNKFLQGTFILFKEPLKPLNQKKHLRNTQEIIGMNRDWTNIIHGAMLAILGICVIVAAIAVSIATYGAAAPLSAAGFALGGSIIASSLTVGALAGTGIGLVATSGFFAYKNVKGDLAETGEELVVIARTG